ncbi:MAG TPA: response regulator, partial [Candidatus Acidoferrum sp.]
MSTSTRKWKALLVDDEELARQLLREMLSGHPEIEIVAECANGMEAVKAAAELSPDLLFLDVQMPKLTGFDVLELVDASKLAVIFVTAYDQYAMKAFEVHALDYLLKPFSRERFESALERAKTQRPEKRAEASSLAASARPSGQFLER